MSASKFEVADFWIKNCFRLFAFIKVEEGSVMSLCSRNLPDIPLKKKAYGSAKKKKKKKKKKKIEMQIIG